ncbi:DcrB-related protein [Tatumella ptyseos]|uniref:DcrB-related protein n=1 Tax=Tatumella ptyseos TaxID=82987 RepID=UPI0026F02059|nr:DcrB-related protein [Tatumella ptyseos]WKX27300.1 DcrB-related protein [Tatumella ptyseos]
MEGQTSKYPFADGYFLTPVPLDNRSVHQLYFIDKQGVTYQIIINHGRLADNQDLPQFVEQEVEKMQRQVPDFCLEANSSPTTLGPAQCAIIQQTHKFLYEGCPFTQYCAFIHLPLHPEVNRYKKNVVILSLASPSPHAEQLAHFQSIINSFMPWE